MKKIIFAALAVLMMLGFAGCSGDLHDVSDVYIVGYKIVNIPDQYEGKTIYAHGQTVGDNKPQPGNAWDNTTPHKAVVTDGEAIINFSEENIWIPGKEENVQIIAIHWDDKVCAGAYGGYDSEGFSKLEAGARYYIHVDCETNKITFVK